jgi:GMP synthase-like glutamine amidotransferase
LCLKNFIITNQNRKFIGICFGHQLIASALGGKVVKSSAGWNMGVKKIDILSKERWMTPFAQNLNVIFNHQDEVIQVPKGAKILAKDYHHPILMYSISNRILSMQFHPEFTPLYQKTLMYNKKSEINPVVIKNAELSYKTPVDLVINTWIKNFINAKV